MGEFGQLDSILLAEQTLVMPPLAHVVDLDRIIAFRRHEEFAGVIIVERENAGLRAAILDVLPAEKLARYQSLSRFQCDYAEIL
jgi:hypothetical protein